MSCFLSQKEVPCKVNKTPSRYVVDFDFLGKDSIRYTNQVPVEKAVYKNLKIFMKGREPTDNLFDRLDVRP